MFMSGACSVRRDTTNGGQYETPRFSGDRDCPPTGFGRGFLGPATKGLPLDRTKKSSRGLGSDWPEIWAVFRFGSVGAP